MGGPGLDPRSVLPPWASRAVVRPVAHPHGRPLSRALATAHDPPPRSPRGEAPPTRPKQQGDAEKGPKDGEGAKRKPGAKGKGKGKGKLVSAVEDTAASTTAAEWNLTCARGYDPGPVRSDMPLGEGKVEKVLRIPEPKGSDLQEPVCPSGCRCFPGSKRVQWKKGGDVLADIRRGAS